MLHGVGRFFEAGQHGEPTCIASREGKIHMTASNSWADMGGSRPVYGPFGPLVAYRPLNKDWELRDGDVSFLDIKELLPSAVFSSWTYASLLVSASTSFTGGPYKWFGDEPGTC